MKAYRLARTLAEVLIIVVGLTVGAVLPGGLLSPRTARAESAAIQPMFESVVGGYGDGGDEATGIAFSMDGAVYSCGHTRLSQYSYSDEITLSQLAVGRPGWTATWEGGGLGARARDIAVASDGSIYVCGYAPTLISTAVLLKYSSAGDLLWQVEFRSEDWASGSALKVEIDASGNAYVLGQFRPLSSQDTFVAKVGPDGSRAWLVTYMPVDWQAEYAAPADLYVQANGACYVVGGLSGSYDDGRPYTKAYVMRLGADGTRRWIRVYNGPGRMAAGFSAVAPCGRGGVYAVGSAGSPYKDILLVRYRADGTRALTRRLGTRDRRDQYATHLAVDSLGRIAICGTWPRGSRGFYVAVLRPDGSVKWSHDFRYGGIDYAWFSTMGLIVDTKDRVCAACVGLDGRIDAYAFTRAGRLRWSSAWSSSPIPGGASSEGPTLRDMVGWGSSSVWVCGATGSRPETGLDQYVVAWPLD